MSFVPQAYANPTTPYYIPAGTAGGGGTLSLSGDVITLSNGGGSVNVATATAVALTTDKTTAMTYDTGLQSTEFAGQIVNSDANGETRIQPGVVDVARAGADPEIRFSRSEIVGVGTFGFDGSQFVFNPPIPGGLGPTGPQGNAGAQGNIGPEGPIGPTGFQGNAGPAGADGATGAQGPAGSNGAVGATGPQGPIGLQGPVGPEGPMGATGSEGPLGPIGPAGADGATGAQGPAGTNGAVGATGPQGPVGSQGPVGPEGAIGPTGVQGNAGADGASSSFYNYKAETTTQAPPIANGRVVWDNAVQTDSSNIYLSHLTDSGDDIDVFLSLLKVNDAIILQAQLNSGQNQKLLVRATPTVLENQYTLIPITVVTSSGGAFSHNDSLLVIVASAGAVGPTGPQGPVGAQGSIGNTGPQGVEGPIGPAGADGATGAQGPAGSNGAVGVTGPQGPVGSQGPIGPEGAIGATGPQGNEGPIGAVGPTGPAGPAGTNGLDGATGPAGMMGATGLQGPEGIQGIAGPTGIQGQTGIQGVAGVQGNVGPTGAVGPAGGSNGQVLFNALNSATGSSAMVFDYTANVLTMANVAGTIDLNPGNESIAVSNNAGAYSQMGSSGISTSDGASKSITLDGLTPQIIADNGAGSTYTVDCSPDPPTVTMVGTQGNSLQTPYSVEFLYGTSQATIDTVAPKIEIADGTGLASRLTPLAVEVVTGGSAGASLGSAVLDITDGSNNVNLSSVTPSFGMTDGTNTSAILPGVMTVSLPPTADDQLTRKDYVDQQTGFSPSNMYYVAENGSDVSGNGSFLRPWLTIQYAIDQIEAIPPTAASQAVINVAPGHYVENLTFTTGYIHVVSPFNMNDVNEVAELTGNVSIAITTGANDKFNKQVGFQGIQISGTITDTSTREHTVMIQDCYLFGDNSNGGQLLRQASTVDCRTRVYNCEINSDASQSFLPCIHISRGDTYFDRIDCTYSGRAPTLRVDGSGAMFANDTDFTNSSFATDASGFPVVFMNSVNASAFGSCLFRYSRATSGRTNGNGYFCLKYDSPTLGVSAGAGVAVVFSTFVPNGMGPSVMGSNGTNTTTSSALIAFGNNLAAPGGASSIAGTLGINKIPYSTVS